MGVINRISCRAEKKANESNETYISLYEVIEKITTEIVQNNRDLVSDITLGKTPESALEAVIIKTINKFNFKVIGRTRDELVKEVLDNIFRYGIIQKLLDNEECNGVFINGPDNVWVKERSILKKTDISFGSIQNITSFIYTIKAKLRGEINENSPLSKFEDAVNKLRIICCIHPMAHVSPTVVIRKHRKEGYSLSELVNMGMLCRELAIDLKIFYKAGANIIICGKGGAGKTTLMRALINELDKSERILIMEESPEIFSDHPNAIQLLVKRAENGRIVNLLDISEKGLLMTIDRYVFGELRMGEAMAFFNGAYSGNASMTSIHAGSARQAIRKALIMMKMSGTGLDDNILLDMLHESVNLIVFLDSFIVTEVIEIVKDDNKALYNDLWKFNISKRSATFIEGKHVKAGSVKSEDLLKKLCAKGHIKEGDGSG